MICFINPPVLSRHKCAKKLQTIEQWNIDCIFLTSASFDYFSLIPDINLYGPAHIIVRGIYS
ncbi:MAG: hypothetical protein EBU46_06960 [Nitrosomonadaceae bacterium]|nr:hypothetical protein [Nitrosomonadaceae bacterium]